MSFEILNLNAINKTMKIHYSPYLRNSCPALLATIHMSFFTEQMSTLKMTF